MGPTALAAPTHDGRMLLMIPWKGRALIGTAHSRQRVGIHDTGAGEGEIDDFIGEINQAFPSLNLARAEVSLVHRGIVPAIERGQGSLALRPDPMLRDHRSDGIEGAVSLVGVKYTTGRGAAQKAIDIVCAKLGRVVKSRTATTKLPCAEGFDRETALRQCLTSGIVSDDTDAARHLTQAYGSAYAEVLALAAARPELGRRIDRRSPVIRAALVHAVRAEMACTLSDAVLRRTALGTMQYPGDDALKVAAEIVGGELGWNDARAEQERQAVLRFYQPEA
jgi:glycerol-3-phosphate dehydrogenase